MNDKEILKIIIMQMLEHNRVHIGKYEKWGKLATLNQLDDIANLLIEAKRCAESENDALRKALELTSIG